MDTKAIVTPDKSPPMKVHPAQRVGRVQRGLSDVSITNLIDRGVTIAPEAYSSKKLFKYPPEEPHFANHFYESYRLYKLTGIDALKCLRLLNSLQITAENLRQFYLSTGRIPSKDEADIISIAGVQKLISIINK